jgi:hypothetical protein
MYGVADILFMTLFNVSHSYYVYGPLTKCIIFLYNPNTNQIIFVIEQYLNDFKSAFEKYYKSLIGDENTKLTENFDKAINSIKFFD